MWLCPSFRRVSNLLRLQAAWRETEAGQHLVVRLHETDPDLDAYLSHDWPEEWTVLVGPEVKAAGACQWAFELYPDEEFYGFIGDDVVPRTPKWDKILSEIAGSSRISYPNDGVWNGQLCTHPCIGGDLLRKVGFWAWPKLEHNFMDTVWMLIGLMSDRLTYCPDVYFEHMHPIVHKAEVDDVYRRGQESYEKDELEFLAFRKMELPAVLNRLGG
jgi:hypothetical protein